MLDQGLWLELVDGWERVVLMQYYRYTQHFQLWKRYGITRTKCTTTVTSIVPTAWLPSALSSRARLLTSSLASLKARTIAGGGIEGRY